MTVPPPRITIRRVPPTRRSTSAPAVPTGDIFAVDAARWREAHDCNAAGCPVGAVILLGSVLEGLLLSRALLSKAEASASMHAPKDKDGKTVAVADWKLAALIDVAHERGWVRGSMAGWSRILRRYRNAVHPGDAAAATMAFTAGVRGCHKSLRVIAGDLVGSCEGVRAAPPRRNAASETAHLGVKSATAA